MKAVHSSPGSHDDISTFSTHLENQEKAPGLPVHVESTGEGGNLAYTDAEHEPALHFRTWIAIAAMCMYNLATTAALFGPPVVVSIS